ncbi:MAG TPA: YbdK family carboxylate-amine ligase [Capillimicrobium sp.]|nr:YbdK family carboxylate-amine ligase [Capillimicrobium sp.]
MPSFDPLSASAANPDADALRAAFDAPSPGTVGIEEELMLLDAGTLDLAHRAPEVVAALGDARFKLELPAAQLEIVLPPAPTVAEAAAALAEARRDLVAGLPAGLTVAAAGLHPFADREGALNPGPRYERTEAEYGDIARRQLVFALQVHVAVGDAERSLAVYNALRSYLPELAALAANAPFHDGRDTGMASARPTIAETLPRQGVPPVLRSWEEYAEALRWVDDPGRWWWELRPHARHGTLELRVPDAQTTVADAAAVAAVTQALVLRLADRVDAGEDLPVHDTWRIEENRWSAARHGVDGRLHDLDTGATTATRERLHALLDELEPTAAALGSAAEVRHARELVERNGALRMRAAAGGDPRAATAWLAERFLA